MFFIVAYFSIYGAMYLTNPLFGGIPVSSFGMTMRNAVVDRPVTNLALLNSVGSVIRSGVARQTLRLWAPK